MREYECKICGATAILKPDGNYQCAYCKQKYTIEQLIDKNPHVDLSFSVRLQMIRKAMEEDYDFPEAMKLCLEMAREYPEQQQLLWFSLLAENRITYIKNGEGRFVPTFLDPEKDSLQNSRYYKKLNEHYRTEADQIERMRLETATEFRKSKPYDVFISYKQHDENGNDTEEKTWADDLYNFLTGKHLRVFLDHFVMDKNNAGWEPQIYAAIRSAKHVIVIGSSVENINSPFVKNEWKRALAFCKCGEEKNVITMCARSMVELLDPELTKKQIVFSDSGERNASIYNRVNTADPWHDFLAQNGCADEEEFVSKKKLVVFDKDQFRTAVLFGSPEDRAMHFDATFRRIKRQNDIDLLEEYAMLDVAKMDVLQLSESMFERAKKKNSKAIYSSVISIVRHYDEGMANRMEYEWKAHLVHAGKVKRIKAIVAAVAAVAIAIGVFIGYRQIDRYEPLKTAESGASVSISSDAFSIAKKFMVRFDSVEIRSDASEFSTYAEAMYAQSQNIAVYDLTFLLFGEQVEPKDDVTVTMPIPASLRGKNVDVYYINDSMECIKLDSEISKEHATISFTTNHFSIYVLAETPYAVSFVSNNGKEIPVQNVNHGKFAAEPQTILKTGYTFGGWYDADGHAWAFDADPIVEDTVLYAKWNANTYQVTYALEEMGVITGESSTSKVTFDADYRLLVPVDTAGKYTFERWYTVAGEQLTDGEGNSLSPWNIAQNTSVCAKWRRIRFTIEIVANGGTNGGVSVINKGDTLYLPVSTRVGYKFLGWYDAATNGIVENSVIPTSHMQIIAKWEANTYTVAFDTDGGTLASSNRTVKYDDNYTLPVPTKNNYQFLGWYTVENVQLTNTSGNSLSPWSITENTTLYAHWKRIELTMTLKAGGGTNGGTKTVYKGNSFTLPTSTWTGCDFLGWYDASGTKYEGTITPTQSMTLYARWSTLNEYSVELERYSCNENNGYNMNESGSSADQKTHSTFELLELVIGGCVKNTNGNYIIPNGSALTVSVKMLQDPESLPRGAGSDLGWWNWYAHDLANDSYSGLVYGTNINGQEIGKGAYYVKITYTDGTSSQSNAVNFLADMSSGATKMMSLNVTAGKEIKSIDVVFVYELYFEHYTNLVWYKGYTNWRCSTTLKFS